jgi:WhiB family transcriptional regulator, redox-sensing transcriptional regulator
METNIITTLVGTRAQWISKAACRGLDPELFFPEPGGATKHIKKICLSCPVSLECLEHAIVHKENFGIWGGTSVAKRQNGSTAIADLKRRLAEMEAMKLNPAARRIKLRKIRSSSP